MKINFSKLTISTAVFFLLSGSVLFLQANIVNGANVIEFNPQIPIPGMKGSMNVASEVDGTMQSDLLARYIKAIYDYGLAVTGILATIVLMGAGVIWLTSGGNESKVTQAKDLITGSLTGMAILFCAWMMLNAVNPELLKLRAINIGRLEVVAGCCDKAKGSGKAEMTLNYNCEKDSGFSSIKKLNANGVCETVDCCIITDTSASADYQTTSIDTCANIPNQTCSDITKAKNSHSPIYTKYTYGIKPGDCSNVARCPGQIISCTGETNAFKGDLGNQQDYWCYNGVFYFNGGQIGEPCGNEQGSICKQASACPERDNGGRDCKGTLACCKE